MLTHIHSTCLGPRALLLLATLGTVLGACSNGASESEFVQACRTGPQEHTTEAMCRCAAHEAKHTLPAAQFRAMVLDMQGKKQESEAAVADLSFNQHAEFAMHQLEILGKCIDAK